MSVLLLPLVAALVSAPLDPSARGGAMPGMAAPADEPFLTAAYAPPNSALYLRVVDASAAWRIIEPRPAADAVAEVLAAMAVPEAWQAFVADLGRSQGRPAMRWRAELRHGELDERSLFDVLLGQDATLMARQGPGPGELEWALLSRVDRAGVEALFERLSPRIDVPGWRTLVSHGLVYRFEDDLLILAPSDRRAMAEEARLLLRTGGERLSGISAVREARASAAPKRGDARIEVYLARSPVGVDGPAWSSPEWNTLVGTIGADGSVTLRHRAAMVPERLRPTSPSAPWGPAGDVGAPGSGFALVSAVHADTAVAGSGTERLAGHLAASVGVVDRGSQSTIEGREFELAWSEAIRLSEAMLGIGLGRGVGKELGKEPDMEWTRPGTAAEVDRNAAFSASVKSGSISSARLDARAALGGRTRTASSLDPMIAAILLESRDPHAWSNLGELRQRSTDVQSLLDGTQAGVGVPSSWSEEVARGESAGAAQQQALEERLRSRDAVHPSSVRRLRRAGQEEIVTRVVHGPNGAYQIVGVGAAFVENLAAELTALPTERPRGALHSAGAVSGRHLAAVLRESAAGERPSEALLDLVESLDRIEWRVRSAGERTVEAEAVTRLADPPASRRR